MVAGETTNAMPIERPMRALAMIPYATLVLVAQAGVDAMPGVVAIREGGMGLGSALILGQAVQVAMLPLGAIGAAWIVDRGSMRAAILPGAVLLGAGFLSVNLQPVGDLGWVLIAQAMAGAGIGAVLTTAFASAAAVNISNRPLAIALLLLAVLAARSVIGIILLGGTLALTAAAAAVVALSLLAVWLAGAASAERSAAFRATTRLRHEAPVWSSALGGLLLAVGMFASFAGADPSRVSAALLTSFLGVGSLQMFDALRGAALVVGLALVLAGAVLVLVPRRVDRRTIAAAGTILLVASAVSGTGAALTFVAMTDVSIPGERAIPLVGAAAMVGSALGIGVGGLWLRQRGRPRIVATLGSIVLACATVAGVVVLAGSLQQAIDLTVLVALLTSLGFGGGVAACALRLVLANSVTALRGLAAGAGVVAASFGSVLGSLIGNGEGVRFAAGGNGAVPVGLLLLPAAGAAAVVMARLLTPIRLPTSEDA